MNSQGGWYQRASDGRFVAWIYIDGKKCTRYARTEAEVELRLQELRQGKSEAASVGSDRQRVADWLAYWLEHVARDQVRPHSWWVYKSRLAHVARRIGRMRLGDLTSLHIQPLYTALRSEEHLAKSSVNSIHITLRTALQAAVDFKIIDHNPTDGRAQC